MWTVNAAKTPAASMSSTPAAAPHGHHRRPVPPASSSSGSRWSEDAGGPGTIGGSLLVFILLVVLGGGIGLLAVSLAGSPKPATDRGPTTRARRPGTDEESADDQDPADTVTPQPEPDLPLAPSTPPVARKRRVPDVRQVPRAHVAIEGRYDEVGAAPWWRRLLSLVALVVLVIVLGVGIAAVAAAVIGAISEFVGTAVG